VWFIQSNFDKETYPFMEIDSFFGFWEASNSMRRGWNVMVKEKTVVFSIHIRDFDKIFMKTPYYKPFFETAKERYEKMVSANEECGENIRILNKVSSKMNQVKNETVSNLLSSIEN